jgi:hypothetical protein
MKPDRSVPDLVHELEVKEKSLNIVSLIFRGLIVGGIIILIVLSYVQTQRLQDHMDCIVNLFMHQNRQQLVITDFEHCKITTGN